MIVRPMRPDEEPAVRALAAFCHPDADAPPAPWFFAYPTLVATDQDGGLLGYAQYGMNTHETSGLAIWLQDTGVEWVARGRGVGHALMTARLELGRALGATLAVGSTEPGNVAMGRILEHFEFREVATVPGLYTRCDPPRDGILFILDLREQKK